MRSFQKCTLIEIMLGTLSLRRLKISSRNIQKNPNNEKIDMQLAGQSSSTPFMNIKDGYNSKKVTFHMQDSLDDKIDKLTSMMSKLTAQDNNQDKQFKPEKYQGRWRGQSRYNYDQGNYQNRY